MLSDGARSGGAGRTACASAAAPAGKASISRESIRQKTPDLERTGRGGRLHALVSRARSLAFPGACRHSLLLANDL